MDPSLLHQHLKCILIRSTVFAWLPLVIVNRKFSCKLIFHHTVLIHSRKGKQCLKATRLRNQTKRLVLLISLCSVSVLWYLYHSMAPTRGYCDLSDWCLPLWLSHAVFLSHSLLLSHSSSCCIHFGQLINSHISMLCWDLFALISCGYGLCSFAIQFDSVLQWNWLGFLLLVAIKPLTTFVNVPGGGSVTTCGLSRMPSTAPLSSLHHPSPAPEPGTTPPPQTSTVVWFKPDTLSSAEVEFLSR